MNEKESKLKDISGIEPETVGTAIHCSTAELYVLFFISHVKTFSG